MDKITKLIKTIWAMILNAIVSGVVSIPITYCSLPLIDMVTGERFFAHNELSGVLYICCAVQIFFFGERRNVFRSKDTKDTKNTTIKDDKPDISTIAMVKHAETAWNLKFEGSWDSQKDLLEFIIKHFDKFKEANWI